MYDSFIDVWIYSFSHCRACLSHLEMTRKITITSIEMGRTFEPQRRFKWGEDGQVMGDWVLDITTKIVILSDVLPLQGSTPCCGWFPLFDTSPTRPGLVVVLASPYLPARLGDAAHLASFFLLAVPPYTSISRRDLLHSKSLRLRDSSVWES